MTRLNAPGGIILYGGANIVSKRSADGCIYVVYAGERPDTKFGTHIYRILPDNRCEWVEYTPFTETRVDVSVEPDGMYITFPVNRDRSPERVKVAGYITPPFPGGTHAAPVTPVITYATDANARDSIAALTRNVAADLARIKKDLETKITALASKPTGMTDQGIKDHIWSISADRLYSELSNKTSAISNLIREIATGKR